MPTFRVPLGGVAGQRAQMSNDPRFVPPLVIGTLHTEEINKLRKYIKDLEKEFKTLSDTKNSAISKFTALSDKLKNALGPDWPTRIPELTGYKRAYDTIKKLNKEIADLNKDLIQSASDDNITKKSIVELSNAMLKLQTELVQKRFELSTFAKDPAIQAIVDNVTRAMEYSVGDTPESITKNLNTVIQDVERQQELRKQAVVDARQKQEIAESRAADLFSIAEQNAAELIARAKEEAKLAIQRANAETQQARAELEQLRNAGSEQLRKAQEDLDRKSAELQALQTAAVDAVAERDALIRRGNEQFLEKQQQIKLIVEEARARIAAQDEQIVLVDKQRMQERAEKNAAELAVVQYEAGLRLTQQQGSAQKEKDVLSECYIQSQILLARSLEKIVLRYQIDQNTDFLEENIRSVITGYPGEVRAIFRALYALADKNTQIVAAEERARIMAEQYIQGHSVFAVDQPLSSTYAVLAEHFTKVALDVQRLAPQTQVDLFNYILGIIRDLHKAFPVQFPTVIMNDIKLPPSIEEPNALTIPLPPGELDTPADIELLSMVRPVQKYKSKLNLSTLHKLGRLKI